MIETRPTLVLHPLHETTSEIAKRFALGKPLTPDQTNYLDWHQKELSHPDFDPILKYYLKSRHKNQNNIHTSFLLRHEIINREAIDLLKKRIAIMIHENKDHRVVIDLSHKQFLEFKKYTIHELIFWHGNQFLTGAPFYTSGTPPLILFQWGNYFGIVKYVVIAGEKAVMGNLLLYFEEMQERSLDRCVKDYYKHLNEEIQLQNKLLPTHKILHSDELIFAKKPELTVSKSYLIDYIPTLRP